MSQTETQSPFLPGTNVLYAWSSTTLGLLKECPRKFQYTVIDGWGSRDESTHLRFGREYHQALEDYAKSRALNINHDDAIHDTIRALHSRIHSWNPNRDTRAGKYKNRETLIGLVIDYLDHYGPDDPAETYIKDDGAAAVELSFRFELDWGPKAGGYFNPNPPTVINGEVMPPVGQPYLLCGHLDRVVNYLGDLYVMDHKTSVSTISGYWFDQWTPSNQMTLYTLAGKVMLNSPIKGVIISAAQILLEKPNSFQRGFAYRTPDQLDEWVIDLHYWFGQAEAFANANYWPQNDTACHHYGGCHFREVCSRSPQVREQYLRANFDKTGIEAAWNPFWDRETEK